MIGRTNAARGVAVGFEIVGGLDRPGNPSENTIWVDTDTAVTGWALSAGRPIDPVNGYLWIETGPRSDIAFNVLRDNAIIIMPVAARQYVDGGWVDKAAMIYQDGEWVDFIDWTQWIVKDGLTKYEIGAKGAVPNSQWTGVAEMTVTQRDSCIEVSASKGFGMVFIGPISLTGVSSVSIDGTFDITSDSSYAAYCSLNVWSSIGTYITSGKVAGEALTATGATLDVSSLEGDYYIGFSIRGASTQYVTNLYVDGAL